MGILRETTHQTNYNSITVLHHLTLPTKDIPDITASEVTIVRSVKKQQCLMMCKGSIVLVK